MRITIVIAGLGGGGAERIAVNLANAWTTRSYQPTILTISQHSRPPAYAIDSAVARCDIGWRRVAREDEVNEAAIAPILRGLQSDGCNELVTDLTLLALLRHAILHTNPDVVISLIDQTNVRVLAAMADTNIPVIVCEVTDARRVVFRGLHRARDVLYRRAAAVVAPDPVIAAWFTARGARATAIHNPLVAPLEPIPAKGGSRRRVVTLSRLSIEKRADWLLRAFASIADRFPDWDLEIYGVGPQQNTLEHLAEDLAPPGRIRICGFSKDPYAVLAGADIFVSSSWVEGFGNAIWEAMACGVPVIAMEAGPSVRRIVRHGVDGLIVTQNSHAALGVALERLMNDEVERKSFATRAPEVVNRFSMQAALMKWDELLAPFDTR
jgi:GalNAc-alpha-(1->4)-GalNAc-alpha-(1->3)-diNAcBac-PP-undecaprenol alpha-1,4-N-acetyl-D-galactosaminyltransferase